jgi:hypothetical protein
VSNNGKAEIVFKSYQNGNLICSDSANFLATTSGWNYEVIALSNQSIVFDSIRVLLTAASNISPLGYEGFCRFFIDDIKVNRTLDISKMEFSSEKIKLFPNPTNNELNFSLQDNSSVITLELFDVAGKSVKTIKYISQGNGEFNHSVDISNLKKGLYFCKFSNGENQFTKKFVNN